MPGEVFVGLEGNLFLYTGSTPLTANAIAFLQDVDFGNSWQWDRQLSPVSGLLRARVSRSLTDQVPTVSFNAFFTSLATFQLAQSATAINADIQFVQAPAVGSAAVRCLSGVFTTFRVRGQENGAFIAAVALEFAEISAYWT